jgi:uncharacterized damage-inducible protein DinB
MAMRFAAPLRQIDLPTVGPERKALESWLDFHRVELLTKLEGLDDEQADRHVVGSLTTLHGLVRHLTKVEHVWFVMVLASSDEPAPFGWPEVQDGDFRLNESEGLEADVTRYLAACERSRKIFSGLSLDEVRQHHRLGEVDVRWVMMHMIEEYAQHNGHADIIRELIDGTTQI